MTAAYGSPGSFGSRVRSKYIGHNTYRLMINLFSKLTPVHEPVHKLYLNYSCSKSHFIRLQKLVAKKLIYRLSQKVKYASKIINPVINESSTNEVTSHFYICGHSIVTFGIKGLCLGFSNTSYVVSLDKFRKSVFDKVKTEVCILKTK